MMRYLASACLLVLCLASPLLAEEPVVDTHRAAAEACVQSLGGEEMFQDVMDATMGILLQQNPDLEPFMDVMTEFFAEVMPWSVVSEMYVELYMESFTETELREVTAFMSTPTGMKYVALVPGLMEDAGAFSNGLLMEHAEELQEVIMKRAMELEAQAAPTDEPATGTTTDGK
jgi:hypothetical protein